MWPWGHVGFGYLLYAVAVRATGKRATAGGSLAVGFGTLAPDLIDKPLAWWVAVLPNGRSLGHSLFTAGLVVGVVVAYCRATDRSHVGAAFGLGYGSHLFADALYPLVGGDWYYLGFLAWPVVPPISYPTDKSFLAHLATLDVGWQFGLEAGLALLAAGVWWRGGLLGLRPVTAAVRATVVAAGRVLGWRTE